MPAGTSVDDCCSACALQVDIIIHYCQGIDPFNIVQILPCVFFPLFGGGGAVCVWGWGGGTFQVC